MYSNFAVIYDNITNEIVNTGITNKLVYPKYANRYGNTADSKDSFSFKVILKINSPDYYFIANKLSSNISQKGDIYVRGAKLFCKKDSVSKKVSSNQDKHFTLLEFTALNRYLAMNQHRL